MLAFFLHGYAFAFGEHNAVIGTQFFLTLNKTNMVNFFFNYVRCAVATTLALGAANERTEPTSYLQGWDVTDRVGVQGWGVTLKAKIL